MFCIFVFGGVGGILGLVLLMMWSKVFEYCIIGKLLLVFGICFINELVIFGLFIVFNFILVILFLIMFIILLLLIYFV